jgi:hypothetical protein
MSWVAYRLLAGLFLISFAVAGCATGPAPSSASKSGLAAGNARISVKMASSIFLQPVIPSERTIYLSGHNTSSAHALGLEGAIRRKLRSMGYRLVDSPDEAHYMLMWNVLYLGERTQPYVLHEAAVHTAAGALAGGYSGALVGALAETKNPSSGGATGALIGAGIGALTGAYLRSNHYMMVVDIQAQEREEGAMAKSTTSLSQGLDNKTVVEHAGFKGWGIYRDRVVAEASGLRMDFPYAQPALVKETANAIAGIF